MSSPSLSSVCCWFRNDSMSMIVVNLRNLEAGMSWPVVAKTYNSLAIISAIISIMGAAVQLFPRRPPSTIRTPADIVSFRRQNTLIGWLAIADFFASVMILTRASAWMADYIPYSPNPDGSAHADGPHIFCAISSALIQYFYTSTYFWTFCYALDVYRRVKSKPCLMRLYHFLGWVLPAVLVGVGLAVLYSPSITSCEHKLSHKLPLYLASYIPILLVMVANPLFYHFISITVRDNLRALGIYTDDERKRLAMLRSRFFCVTLAFYICWSANVLNGVLLIFIDSINLNIFLALWAYMAVVNPLQAFLNSLVYRGVGGCNIRWDPATIIPTTKKPTHYMGSRWRYRNKRADIQHNSTTDLEDSAPAPTERSSLLSFRT